MPDTAATRPRIEGDREQEVLAAARTVLAETGYDRLTMDAVATAARASKATLYRRWSSKAALVIEALCSVEDHDQSVPDHGSLREDLVASFCTEGAITNPEQLALFSSVLTAMVRDPEFAAAFRREVIGPKIATQGVVYERARRRGELRDDVDLALVGPALPGVLLHRYFVLGEVPDRAAVERVVDQIILPAVTRRTPVREGS